MPPVSLLIKPASSGCNIKCKYCFYRSISETREKSNFGFMSQKTLETMVKKAFFHAEEFVSFAFQGGEPTLIGLEFYRNLIELQKKYNTRKLKVQNTIQTNGTLIDENWAKFLYENNFLVGLSLDGPRKINDGFRVDGNGGTFNRVMDTVKLLRKYNVDFNIVSVVTSKSFDKAAYIYKFFKKHKFLYLQFIPCLDEDPCEKQESTLSKGEYGRFLNDIFDLWYEDFIHGYNIDIRMFSNLVQMAAGYRPEACGMTGKCSCYFLVEGDGSVYPCDFYARDELKLGTVEDDFESILDGKVAKEFTKSSLLIDEKCKKCNHFYLCRGGCRRWREPFVNGKPSLNVLCEDYQVFFEHCSERIYKLGAYLKKKLKRV